MSGTGTTTVIDALGYCYREPNVMQRATQHVAASRPGAWVFKRTLHPIDKLLFKITGGRVTVPGLYDVADDVLVDVEVGVREDHPCADDLAPRDVGLC